jgi:hypothetical protein
MTHTPWYLRPEVNSSRARILLDLLGVPRKVTACETATAPAPACAPGPKPTTGGSFL